MHADVLKGSVSLWDPTETPAHVFGSGTSDFCACVEQLVCMQMCQGGLPYSVEIYESMSTVLYAIGSAILYRQSVIHTPFFALKKTDLFLGFSIYSKNIEHWIFHSDDFKHVTVITSSENDMTSERKYFFYHCCHS